MVYRTLAFRKRSVLIFFSLVVFSCQDQRDWLSVKTAAPVVKQSVQKIPCNCRVSLIPSLGARKSARVLSAVTQVCGPRKHFTNHNETQTKDACLIVLAAAVS